MFLVLISLLVLLSVTNWQAVAYPASWASVTSDCTAHPTSALGQHGAPLADTSITFTVVDTNGSTVTTVCPGGTYNVTVGLSSSRKTFLTASVGTLNDGQFDLSAPLNGAHTCRNRAGTTSGVAATFTRTWKAPTTGTGVKFEVTSAVSMTGAYLQSSMAIPYGADCAVMPALGAPDTSSDTASPPATAVASHSIKDTPASPSPARSCPASDLGYQCTITTRDNTIIHYSHDTALPVNLCTGTAAGSSSGQGMVHFAVQANTEGYVSLSFPEAISIMTPAEAVIGWVSSSGQPVVHSYSIPYNREVNADGGSSWATNMGVALNGGVTTICFSRPMSSSSSRIASIIDVNAVKLNWAIGSTKALGNHYASGGLSLNMASGVIVIAPSSNKPLLAAVHGALMLVAFAVLMPLGALLARHKWMFGRKEGGISPIWFKLHMYVQCLAVVIAVISLIIALASFGNKSPGGSLWRPHQVIGIIAVAMAVTQLLIGFARPVLTAPSRGQWRALHYGWGRLALLAGATNLFLGAVLMHDLYAKPISMWASAAAVLVGIMAAASGLMEVAKCKVERRGQYNADTQRFDLVSKESASGLSVVHVEAVASPGHEASDVDGHDLERQASAAGPHRRQSRAAGSEH